MVKGFISKIIESALTREDAVISVALGIFFKDNPIDISSSSDPDSQIELGLFNEWVIFDYKFKGYKNYLDKYIQTNPDYLDNEQLEEYKILNSTQRYRLFSIEKISPELGLMLKDILNGKDDFVFDKALTRQVKIGMQIFLRIGEVEGQLEVISSDTKLTPQLRPNFIEDISELLEHINPFKLNTLFFSNPSEKYQQENILNEPKIIDKGASELALSKLLREYNIYPFATTKMISKWIFDSTHGSNINMEYATIIVGLMDDSSHSLKNIEKLLTALNSFYIHQPQQALNGRTPLEMSMIYPKEGRFINDIAVNTVNFSRDYFKHLSNAEQFASNFLPEESLAEYAIFFDELLKNYSTIPFLYRLLANKANMHFMAGEPEKGLYFLDKALSLNPNYDFGIKLKNSYDNGELDIDIQVGIDYKRQKREKFEKSVKLFNIIFMSLEEIFKLLKRLKINIDETSIKKGLSEAVSVDDFIKNTLSPLYKYQYDYQADVFNPIAQNLWLQFTPDKPDAELYIDLVNRIYEEDEDELYSKEQLIRILIRQTHALSFSNHDKVFKYSNSIGDFCFLILFCIENWIPSSPDSYHNQLTRELLQTFKEKLNNPIGEIAGATLAVLITKDMALYNVPVPKQKISPEISYVTLLIHGKLYEKFSKFEYSAIKYRELIDVIKNNKSVFLYDWAGIAQNNLLDVLCKMPNTKKEIQILESDMYPDEDEIDYSEQTQKFAEEPEFLNKIQQFAERYIKEELEKDSATSYLKYLEKFELNFKTPNITTSIIKTYQPSNGKKNGTMGRNDKCYCGSGKKYKKCHGK
jgi:hypothetical protein